MSGAEALSQYRRATAQQPPVAAPKAWGAEHGPSVHSYRKVTAGAVRSKSGSDPDLVQRAIAAVAGSKADFRSVASVARELGVGEAEARSALQTAAEADVLRHPLSVKRQYPDLFRLRKRGPTPQERWWRVRAFLIGAELRTPK